MNRNTRNALYFGITVLLMMLAVPAFARENMKGQSQYQKQYSTQDQRNYQRTNATAYSGSSNTYTSTSTFREAAQSAYAPPIGQCNFSFGAQSRSFGISFSGRARRLCEDRELALLLNSFGLHEQAAAILAHQYSDWYERTRPKVHSATYVCNPRKPNCARIEPVDVTAPDS